MASGVKLMEGYVEVTADGRTIPSDIEKQVENDGGTADRAGKSFGRKIVGGIVGSIVAVKIGQFIGESITAGSDLTETMNKANTIFGASAGNIDKWGDTAATNLGLSKAAAVGAAAGFGNMFTQLGYLPDQAAEVSKSTVQMAADLGSFNNLPTADVADRISAALRGEYDSLQALIPNINAARVEQEAMAMTGKTNADELTAQEKAAATLAIVQKDGSAAMGDFAKTSGDAANQQKIAAAQTEDLKGSLGGSLLPVVNEILGVVTTQFLPMLQSFADWLKENESLILPVVVALGLLAAAIWVVNIAMYANPIGLIIAAAVLSIGFLIATIVMLASNWDAVVAWITTVWEGFVGWITGIVDAFVGWWNGVWGAVGSFIQTVWANIVAGVTGAWNAFIGFIVGAIMGYVGFWYGVWSGIASFFVGVWNGIVSFGRNAITGLVGFFTALPGQIMGAISGAATWLVSVGADIIAGLRRGIANAWSGLVSWFQGLFGNLIDIAKRILGIASPSLVFDVEVGEMIPAGAERGVKRGMPSFYRTVKDAFALTPEVALAGVPGGGAGYSSSRDTATASRGDLNITIMESTDPLGTTGRVAREYKKWRGR
jgi:hypothetical protein